ncbi:DUF3828 domain-containing protein [Providencia alcalifaciens]|uniref:DUF3828 domain-containing protein n=1 Tax=Providencia alcalifaciens TaxID=126385 RepID=UPI0015EC009C|nr:DUF3828 domain-containing protein [Providencia alcalifaciens]EJF7710988.1 DUF3828 domain-containing protein [Providencia rettgeri]QLQ97104.1 DUF3828 domain-containing protein [Providencia alcalifaciens]
MNKHISNLLIIMISIFFVSTVQGKSSTSPESTVFEFYSKYLAGNSGSLFKLQKEYMTSELEKKLTDSTDCNYDSDRSKDELKKICKKDRECKVNNGNTICNWQGTWIETDVNYFLKSQDDSLSWQQNINVFPISENKNLAYVFSILGDGSDENRYLLIELKKDKNEWRINKVINTYDQGDK